MMNCLCIVQAGQAPATNEAALKAALNQFSEKAFGESLDITWLPVAAGSGFTEGEPSTSSVVTMTANAPVDQAARPALLRELVALWTSHTGCSDEAVVAVISEPR